MADQKNVRSNQPDNPAPPNRSSQQTRQNPQPQAQQQAHSLHRQQQRAMPGEVRQTRQGVEDAQRSLADREREEADGGAPDDLLPGRQPAGWTSRNV
ncbi:MULTISPECIES: hypothetical protein [Hydrocarboniphaga]|uniref:Uncharacterized protein n=1 Tax=Hydrocarboniphaga effusa AP103 TaxID=1172194 RepID=I8T6F8_9GAMM|nr:MULTISPECIES: hypothetical protein [Hydrocarboniphaga]EIT69505.1 hypothetical protein WQQ_30870 [Hydrocarboniphaga effusa AP103]MDZ4080823.1 hypothetical protein [Hydrocarboniphaga sp.]MDZ4080866.1 hypothetical protein [Hydrocarboniphaga sp.]